MVNTAPIVPEIGMNGRRKSVHQLGSLSNNNQGQQPEAPKRERKNSQLGVVNNQLVVLEEVKPNHMSSRFIKEMKTSSEPTTVSSCLKFYLQVGLACLLSVFIMLIAYIPFDWNDPFLGVAANTNYILGSIIIGGFPLFFGVSIFMSCFAAAPLPWKSHAITSLVGSFSLSGCTLILGQGFGIFPVPFTVATLAFVPLVPVLFAFYLQYPADLRTSSEFKEKMLLGLAVLMLNVAAACALAAYSSIFKKVSSDTQVLLAFVLPFVKFSIKFLSRKLCSRANPDFAHGAQFPIQGFVGSISCIIFTAVKDPTAFLCMVLIVSTRNHSPPSPPHPPVTPPP